ncbi:MAG: NRDE family protein [Phycisphaeraceae bacterium]
MCTVTLVPKPGEPRGFRMACNRDESHGRAPAEPPQVRTRDGIAVLMPIDPSSGGTWVGVNERGLALTLLNYNPPAPPTGRDRSRGDVIPALLGAACIDEVIERCEAIERDRMMPFRLVACDGQRVLLWRSTESIERAAIEAWVGEPMMWTSSGLGDEVVEGPRRVLFSEWFGNDPSRYEAEQAGFHRHRWPDRLHLSVCMHRDDARTVSHTVVDVTSDRIAMRYDPDGPGQAEPGLTQVLTRRLVER